MKSIKSIKSKKSRIHKKRKTRKSNIKKQTKQKFAIHLTSKTQFHSTFIPSAKLKKNDLIVFIHEEPAKAKMKIAHPLLSKMWKQGEKANQNNANNANRGTVIKSGEIHDKNIWVGSYQLREMGDYPFEHLEKLVDNAIHYLKKNRGSGGRLGERLGERLGGRIILYFDKELIKQITPVEIILNKIYESFYTFSYFKSGSHGSSNSSPNNIYISPIKAGDRKSLSTITERCAIISRGKEIGRDLENFPSNYLYPEKYAEIVRQLVKPLPKTSMKIFYQKDLAKKGFNTILAVGQGSVHPPVLVELQYNGAKGAKGAKNAKGKPIIIIGKGITFDSGGLNLKHGDFSDMKMDKTGASVALSTFINLARLGVRRNVVALLPLAENMPDGGAIRPGDVIRSYSGKTVEITNTDAEGRLVLCDALAYAQEKNPQFIIDVATLTGAAERLTNGQSAVYLGNESSREWRQEMEKAKKNTQEKIFELPLWNDWKPYLHSTIADIKNTVYDAHADIFLSSLFLSYFVDKNIPWIHIDLSNNYPDRIRNGKMIYPSARGSSILLLTNMILNYGKE